MASRVGTLYVDLIANTKSFIDELDKSRTKSATFGVAVGTIFANVAQSAARMAKDAALAFPRLVEAQIDLADETNKASQRTGVQVEALSALRHAAELSDVSFDTLQTSLGRLSRNMLDTAHGTGAAKQAFRELGISVADAGGNIRPIQEVLGDVAEQFAGMQDGAQQTALALQLFGRGGQALIPFLNQGREGLAAMTKEAERLGLVISAKTAQAAEDFNDNMTRLRSTLGGVGLQVAAQVLPAFVNLTNAFVNAATEGDRVKTVGEAIGGGLRTATQFALGSALAVTGFVGALSLLAEEIQRIRLEAAKGLNLVLPKSLEGDVDGLQKGLEERQKRTLAIADATQTILDLMNAVDTAATKAGKAIGGTGTLDIDPDADKKRKELESLIASFEKALKPADDLEKTIRKLEAAGKDSTEILKVYGDQILETAGKQRELGGTISAYIAGLESQKQAQQDVAASAETQKLAIDGLAFTLQKIADGSFSASIRLQGLRDALSETQEELNRLNAIGEIKSLAIPDDDLRKMVELPDDLGKIKEVFGEAKDTGKDFGLAVSTSMTNAAQSIAEVAIEGKGLADTLDNASKQIQKAIISNIIEQALNPLLNKLREVSSVSSGGLLSKILGIGASVAGSAVGGASFGSSSIPSVLGGGATIQTPLVGQTLAFAEGGKIAKGMTALVGELGTKATPKPELYIPDEFLQQPRSGRTEGAALPIDKPPVQFNSLVKRFSAEKTALTSYHFPKVEIPSVPRGTPFLIGTRGPEIFKPPEPGTIVPITTPEGSKIYEQFKSWGRTREHGGSVGYMTGERGREMFLPASMKAGGGQSVQVIYQVDARGSGPGTADEIRRALSSVEDRAVQRAVRTMQELKLRTV